MNTLSRFACTIFSVAGAFTSNAQSNWSLVHTPTDPTEQYNGIYAVTQNKVVLSSEGGRIYRSTNGCQTVDLYQVPGNYSILGDIDFADPQNGFIGGGCWFPFGDCISSAMLRTTDGGATWSAQQLGNTVGTFMAINALPNGEVFAVGDYAGVYHFDPQTQTWDSLGTPAEISGYHLDLKFLDSNNGFLLHHGVNTDKLYRTINGGTSWSTTNAFMPQLSYGGNLHFFTAQKGVLSGDGGTIYQTNNGGTDWAPLYEFGNNELIQQIEFIDAQTGYTAVVNNITQKGRILKTVDGGVSWTPELDINNGNFQGFHFVDQNNGYAFDNDNRIYRRTATSGIADVKSEATVSFSPNPVTSTLTISRKSDAFSNQDILFSLYDVTGRRVLQQTLTGETTLVSCTHLADGIYWYECDGEVGKVIVARF